jgi:hypothetical protein
VSEFIVPPLPEDSPWPSLGADVCDWMTANLAFGPGDLLGQPFRVDDEDRAIFERAYQVFPPDHKGRCHMEAGRCTVVQNARCGRRRFDTVVIMTRKGTKKSERLAATAAVELAENGPIRCDGFRRSGSVWVPVGRPVVSPSVFLFAFAKEQVEDTSWEAMRQMILLGPGHDLFDVWDASIMRRGGDGEAKPLASAPDSRDGGKTTFQGKEEGHRWTLPRQKEAHQTTRGNLSKRPIAEPWELHATTAYAPGEGSVIEDLHDAARKLTRPEAVHSRMFFFYRWADTRIQIHNEDGSFNLGRLREAIVDASGSEAARWSDPDGIASLQFLAAGADPDYAERVWLNRLLKRTEIAFDAEAWKRNGELGRSGYRISAGAPIVLGFDGSRGTVDPRRSPDHTGLVATEIATGYQQKLGHWDPAKYGNQIPRHLVDIAIDDAFTTFDVWRLYADPPDWDSEIARWKAGYGPDRVVEWFTWRDRQVGFAMANYAAAIASGEVLNDGDGEFAAHIGHAHRRPVNARDDKGQRLWTIQKEREGSPLKIDLAMCGALSWEARTDAVAAGVGLPEPDEPSIYETRGILSIGAA